MVAGQFTLPGIFCGDIGIIKTGAYGSLCRDASSAFDKSQTNQYIQSLWILLYYLVQIKGNTDKSLSTLKARFSWGEWWPHNTVSDYDRFWQIRSIAPF